MSPIKQFLANEMKQWLLECFEEEYNQEQINESSYEELKQSVNRYYDGGFKVFVDDMLDLKLVLNR